MKNISWLLVITLVLSLITPSEVYAGEITDFSVEQEAIENLEVEIISEDGKVLVFYKEGTQYKVRHEDGTIQIWGYDIDISSMDFNISADTSVGGNGSAEKNWNYINPDHNEYATWTYLGTDRYITFIDPEIWRSIMTVADAIRILSPLLGVSTAVAAWIFAARPDRLFRSDDAYASNSDPFYWMLQCHCYADSSYTGEPIHEFTTYMNVT